MKNPALNAALRPFIGNKDVEFSVSLGNPRSFIYHTETVYSVAAVRGMIKRLPSLAADGIAIVALGDGDIRLIYKNY